jgi:hypothetical protein
MFTVQSPSTAEEIEEAIALLVAPAAMKASLNDQSVEIVVTMASRRAPSGGAVTLVFDASIIDLIGVYPVEERAPFKVMPRFDNAQGWITVNLMPTGALSPENHAGGIFSVHFMPIDIGRSEIALVAGRFTDDNGSSISIAVRNGTVEVFIGE